MRVRPLVVLLAFGFAGCRESTAPERGLAAAPILGLWSTAFANSDGTSSETSLNVSADLTFTRDWRRYSQGPQRALVAYVTTTGTYSVRGDSLFAHASVAQTWDRDFNGGFVTITLVRGGGPYGEAGARFEIRNDSLSLHYLSYPADAPVETVETLSRVKFIGAAAHRSPSLPAEDAR